MYSVAWHSDAAEEAQELYFGADASLRAIISGAILELERQLAARPMEIGESRDEPYRVAFIDGLAVLYAVDTLRQEVSIRSIWMPRRR